MRSRAAAGAWVLVAATLLAGSCQAQGEDGSISHAVELQLNLLHRSGEARHFGLGEPVRFVLGVRNPASEPVRLSFGSTKTHDFVVTTASGKELWRHSGGLVYAQMLSELVLAPGETREFEARWEPTDLPAGRYHARGLLATLPEAVESAAVEFTVE